MKQRTKTYRSIGWIILLMALIQPMFADSPQLEYRAEESSLREEVATTSESADGADSLESAVPSFIPWIGEVMDYYVALGIIPAGKARLAVLDTVSLDGHLTIHAMSTARSAKGYDLVFKVRDTVETWFDADSIYALRSRKKLQEGRYRDEKYVEFSLADSIVRWWDDGVRKPDLSVPPRVQDVLSAGFYARTLSLVVGDTLSIPTHDVNKTYDLLVIVHSRENVETLAGRFDAFKVEPVLRSGGLFKKEKGARVFVWVTADERRILVKMESRVSFGIITAELESYTPPRTVP